MTITKYLIVFIGIFSILLVSCAKESSNEVKNQGNKIIVQNRIGQDDKYTQYRVITDKTTIEKLRNLLNGISWENAKVSMIHPSDYKFYFEGKNQPSPSTALIYELWISPGKEKVELVIDSESKYVQLDKKRSAQLFKMLTGEKLN